MLKKRAQATIEFTFAMIIILFLIYGMIKVFRWVGIDMADRRIEHDQVLKNPLATPAQQITPNFSRPKKIGAVYRGFNLTGP